LAIPASWAAELTLGALVALLAQLLLGDASGSMESPALLLLGNALGSVATLALVWLIAARWCGLPLRQRLALGPVPRLATAMGVLVGLLGFGLATVVTYHFSNGQSRLAHLTETPLGLLCVSLIAVVFAPLTEEVYYRGLLLPLLADGVDRLAPQPSGARTRAWALAAVVVTLWFGGIHIPQLIDDPLVIPVIFIMGGVWSAMRWYTKSLWPSLASHLTYNALLIGLSWLSFDNW
jgi:membrane protease YdiL (CAAX protease family)